VWPHIQTYPVLDHPICQDICLPLGEFVCDLISFVIVVLDVLLSHGLGDKKFSASPALFLQIKAQF
jgi:hypothetical protein